MKYIAPSILSADFAKLGEDVKCISDAGAQYIHIDIMDGMFVPNISFGAPIVKAIRKYSDKIFDVHMMVQDPGRYVEDFAKAGADIITIHAEASTHLDRDIHKIKESGCKAGVVLNPATSLHELDYILPELDMVLLMSVNPGFGNQKFIPYIIEKTKALKDMIDKCGSNTLIEIDGGVNLSNCASLCEAGVDVLVAGSAVFKNDTAANVKAFLDILKRY